MSLLARILAAVMSALVVAGAVVMGFFVGAVLVGLALLGGAALAARVWWLRRKLRSVQPAADPSVIEGEYRVVDAGDERERARLR